MYVGFLKYGLPDGSGTYTDSANNKFEGFFRWGTLTSGRVTYSDGTKYDGGLKDRKKQGYGHLLYKDKTYVYGKWENDVMIQRNEEGKWKMKSGIIEYKKKK